MAKTQQQAGWGQTSEHLAQYRTPTIIYTVVLPITLKSEPQAYCTDVSTVLRTPWDC